MPLSPQRSLASDNHSGIHPEILKALSTINQDHFHSYEGDPWSLNLRKKIKEIFGENFESYIVFNGTAANTLALNHFVKPWQSILCSEEAHLQLDECGAPEKFIGCKVLPLKSQGGKIQVQDILAQLKRMGDQHYSQVKAVSITQPTELGCVYSLDELKEISDICKKNNLYLHIDGARLANAAISLKTDFKVLCQYADAVSFGGTKNGLLFGELVLLNKKSSNNSHDFKFERKQAMQLASKSRFIAHSFLTYFENDLWKEIAKHSLDMAQMLERQLGQLDIRADHLVQSNAVFCSLPKAWIKSLREKVFFYVWDEKAGHTPNHFQVRLMTSFDTRQQDLDDLCSQIEHLKSQAKPSI